MINLKVSPAAQIDLTSCKQPFPLMDFASYGDIWQAELLKYLSFPDLANLKEACKRFNKTIKSVHYNSADLSQKIEVVHSRIQKLERRKMVNHVLNQQDRALDVHLSQLESTRKFIEAQLAPKWIEQGGMLAKQLFEASVLKNIYELDYIQTDRSQKDAEAFMPFSELEGIIQDMYIENDPDKIAPFIKGECCQRPFFSLLIQNKNSCSAITIYESEVAGEWRLDIQTPQFIEGEVPDEVWHAPFIQRGKIANQKIYNMLQALFRLHTRANSTDLLTNPHLRKEE